MKRSKWGIVFLALAAGVAWAAVSAGMLDDTFGTSGVVVDANGGDLFALGEQSTGKVVAAGAVTSSGTQHWIVRRYDTDGSLDTTFGTNGTAAPFSGTGYGDSIAKCMAIDGSDRILAAGIVDTQTTSGNGKHSKTVTTATNQLVRLSADGSLDTTFGDSGALSLDSSLAQPTALAIQPDGKILVAGSTGITSGKGKNKTIQDALLLLRYDADGSVDSSFGSNGAVIDDVSSSNDIVVLHGMALQSDGSILVYFASGSSASDIRDVARYGADGTRDLSFGTDGLVTVSGHVLGGIAVDSNDRVLLAVGAYDSSTDHYAGVVYRFDADGILDTSFGTDGEYTTGIVGSNVVTSIAVASGDRPVVVGYLWDGSGVFTARLTADGAADTTYGTDGLSDTADVSSSATEIPWARVLVDQNGNYVAAGSPWFLARWQG